jgi:hypothetical protein
VRSSNTYTANGATEMIKGIIANIKMDDLEILSRMDVAMKLSAKYPYQEIYEKSLSKKTLFYVSICYFHLNRALNNHFQCPNL